MVKDSAEEAIFSRLRRQEIHQRHEWVRLPSRAEFR